MWNRLLYNLDLDGNYCVKGIFYKVDILNIWILIIASQGYLLLAHISNYL